MSDGREKSTPGGSRYFDLAVVLLVAWAARMAFIVLMPATFSYDVRGWNVVARVLADGQNPYAVTRNLNWPPLWMQVTWAIGRLSDATQVPFPRILQFVLIFIESATIVTLFSLLKLLAPGANNRLILLAGVSLNPIAILLICQHGNFDVLVGLWIVLFATHLILFQRSGDTADWLAACLFLGLAALTKTVPLVLAPLLALGVRGFRRKVLWLGTALVLGPMCLGLSIIYVLSPNAVMHNVILYRSIGGYFGISGLSGLLGIGLVARLWAALFPWALLGLLLWIGRRLWHTIDLSAADLVLLAVMLLAAVPTLGPGYAPQYLYWYLPLLVATVPCYSRSWRKLLVGSYVVAALTYVVEYALFDSHGMFLVQMLSANPRVAQWAKEWATSQGQTLVRLPLFLAFLAVLSKGVSLLRPRFVHV